MEELLDWKKKMETGEMTSALRKPTPCCGKQPVTENKEKGKNGLKVLAKNGEIRKKAHRRRHAKKDGSVQGRERGGGGGQN